VNILVLGGHGFIGSHIVDNLIQYGNHVRIFARQKSDYSCNAEWFQGDFLDTGKLSEALVGMDLVIHCVSSTVPSTSAVDPVYDIKTNLIGTVQLLRIMSVQGVHRLIYFSSGGTVYGNPDIIPVPEEAPLRPISSYGSTKVAIENFITVYGLESKIQTVILRPSNPFGERQGHKGVQGLISTILNNIINDRSTIIYGDGNNVRDYVYISDVVDLVRKVVDSSQCGVYNVGSNIGYTINQIMDFVEEATGIKVLREYRGSRTFDVKEIVLDCSSAKQHFNWKPAVSIVLGIKKQFDWLKMTNVSANR
jgi:UDP-glucose 4-epimerase